MKRRPPSPEAFLRKLRRKLDVSGFRGALNAVVDSGLVAIGWLPEEIDGSGKALHISDTPSSIYGYLSRLLKRVNPSVIVHTGDLADDIKLELYPGERERYRATIKRLMNILQAPHRRVILVLGNHDERELLPWLPPDCTVYDGAENMTFWGTTFRISHYPEGLLEHPAQYNLFGHCMEPSSHDDGNGRHFFNGLEWMRLIDPRNGEIQLLRYPRGTDDARLMRKTKRH